MSSRERELITALAEGVLEDESEARALIERSFRLRTQYEEQKRALEALALVPAAELTVSEATDLRRDIWTALTTSEPAPVNAGRSPWAWGYAAVFLFAAVGMVAVLNGSPWANTASGNLTSSPGTQATAGLPPSNEAATDSAQRSLRLAQIVDRAKEDRLEFDTLTSGSSGVEADWDRCSADIKAADYQVLGTIEDDGSLLVVARLVTRFGDPDSDTYLVVDLETCEIAYSDD